LKTSAKGVKFMSASFSEPYIKIEPQINGTLKQTIIHESNFDNDDLPF